MVGAENAIGQAQGAGTFSVRSAGNGLNRTAFGRQSVGESQPCYRRVAHAIRIQYVALRIAINAQDASRPAH